MNECLLENGGCEHRCEDLDGSYLCTCLDGYALSADMHSCELLNSAGVVLEPQNSFLTQAKGVLDYRFTESISLAALIMCILNITLIIIVAVVCWQRRGGNKKGLLGPNLRHAAGVYGNNTAKAQESVNAYGTVTSKLSYMTYNSDNPDSLPPSTSESSLDA